LLYNLLFPLADGAGFFNLFKYLTFRSGGALITSLLITLYIGPKLISWLKSWQKKGQPIREDGPASHLITKKGTPTMGGLMILFSLMVSVILWADYKNVYIWVTLFVTLAFGALGFVDDYLKVTKQNTKGVKAKGKMLGQIIVSLIAWYVMQNVEGVEYRNHLAMPFLKDFMLDMGVFYAVFVMVVIVGASNAVNLTDGLDGLVSIPIVMASLAFGFICYFVGHKIYAEYLYIAHIPNVGELAVFCSALIGSTLGFLWYNAHPAEVFMGDTGSLAIGGSLGTIAVATKHEIVLAIVGGLFVIEALSVMIQVWSFKTRGVRVFKMAPIHHHFEKIGWPETKVVIRFWIVSIVFALIGLATLKLR